MTVSSLSQNTVISNQEGFCWEQPVWNLLDSTYKIKDLYSLPSPVYFYVIVALCIYQYLLVTVEGRHESVFFSVSDVGHERADSGVHTDKAVSRHCNLYVLMFCC